MAISIRLVRSLYAATITRQLEDRTSLILALMGNFGLSAIEFLALWSLVGRFGPLVGWTFAEVALGYGVASTTFAISNLVGHRLQHVGETVHSGDFDRLLLRPASTLLQLVTSDLPLRTLGRLLQGLIALAWGLDATGVAVAIAGGDLAAVGLLAAILVGGIALFAGLQLLAGAWQFWSHDGAEVGNVVTYGTETAACYPLPALPSALRWWFLTVIPVACVTYLPLVALLGRDDPLGTPRWLQVCAPVAGFALLAVGMVAWRAGVRRYTSTGT